MHLFDEGGGQGDVAAVGADGIAEAVADPGGDRVASFHKQIFGDGYNTTESRSAGLCLEEAT